MIGIAGIWTAYPWSGNLLRWPFDHATPPSSLKFAKVLRTILFHTRFRENWQKVKTFVRNVVLYNTHSEGSNFFVCSSCLTTNILVQIWISPSIYFLSWPPERILGSLKNNFNIHNISNIFNIQNNIQNNELKSCKQTCKQLNSNEKVIRDNLAM